MASGLLCIILDPLHHFIIFVARIMPKIRTNVSGDEEHDLLPRGRGYHIIISFSSKNGVIFENAEN